MIRAVLALVFAVGLVWSQPAAPTNLEARFSSPMATFVQSVTPATATDPISCTFGSSPTEGNLLIAVMAERSGVTEANHTVSGSGWTKRVGRDVSIADGNYRRTLSVWTKVAGASEPSTITMDDGTTNTGKYGIVAEYTLEGGESEDQWEFVEAVSNDNGNVADAVSIGTGTTASLAAGQYAVLGIGALKHNGGGTTFSPSWASLGLTSDVSGYPASSGSFKMWLGIGSLDSDTAGTKTSTLSITGGTNTGLIAALLVFRVQAAGGGDDYTVASTGAVTVGGTSTIENGPAVSSSGLLDLGGAGQIAPGFEIEATSLITLGGTGATVPGWVIASSGQLDVGGSHTAVPEFVVNSEGLVDLSGAGAVAPEFSVVSSGLLVLSGAGAFAPDFSITSSGLLVLSGSSVAEYETTGDIVVASDGTVILSGSSQVSRDVYLDVSALLNMSGSSIVVPEFNVTSSGNLILSGGGTPVPGFNIVSSGNLGLSGDIAVVPEFVVTSGGLLNLSGSGIAAFAGPFSSDVAYAIAQVLPDTAMVVKLKNGSRIVILPHSAEVSLWKELL